MSKVIKYLFAYFLWVVDLGLSFWLFFLGRTTLLGLLAFFYEPGDFQYTKMVDLVDRIFVVVAGLGWMVFAVVTEEYYRSGALKEKILLRFARVTGPILLSLFIVDLILFWLQGVGAGDWLRWLILVAELGIGLAMVVSGRIKTTKTQP